MTYHVIRSELQTAELLRFWEAGPGRKNEKLSSSKPPLNNFPSVPDAFPPQQDTIGRVPASSRSGHSFSVSRPTEQGRNAPGKKNANCTINGPTFVDDKHSDTSVAGEKMLFASLGRCSAVVPNQRVARRAASSVPGNQGIVSDEGGPIRGLCFPNEISPQS